MTTKIILMLAVGGALVLVWGYWYALNHAALHLRVDDYGLKSPSRAYDTPHGVSLVLRDAANGQLAVARSDRLRLIARWCWRSSKLTR